MNLQAMTEEREKKHAQQTAVPNSTRSIITNKSLSALCLKRFVGYYANLARTALALSTERVASGIMIK